MKALRAILAFLAGSTLALAPAMKFLRYTHPNAYQPEPLSYIAIVAVLAVVFSFLGGIAAAKIAPQTAHGVGHAICYFILACACWSLYISPGRDHWFVFIGILLMPPSVYLGNRIAS